MSGIKANSADKPENEISPLLDGEDFQGFHIQEWTLKQLVQISPVLEDMVGELENRGVTWEQFSALFEEAKKKKADGQEKTTMSGALKILSGVLKYVPAFLAVSLDREISEIEALKGPLSLTLMIKVISINLEHLKSFFEMLVGNLKGLRGTTLSGAAFKSPDSSTSS